VGGVIWTPTNFLPPTIKKPTKMTEAKISIDSICDFLKVAKNAEIQITILNGEVTEYFVTIQDVEPEAPEIA
jgi:hypothetical protein